MLTTWNRFRRFSILIAAAACVLPTAPASAGAQTREADARWQPWIGCWTASARGVYSEPEPQQVCVVPAAGASAVDVVTVSGSKIVSREHIDANGEHRKSERDGCVGWESAQWSSDMRRVYLQSEYDCTGGLKRGTTGLMATAANGDWLDIVGVAMRDNVGVRVLRHRASTPLNTLPADTASAVGRGSRPSQSLRTLLPIGDAEIIEASHHVSAPVVEALLAEARQPFTVNAARLVKLSDAGVDGRVIDMMVALSYPKAFAIKPSPGDVGELATKEGGGGGASGLVEFGSFGDCGPYSSGLSLYGWDGCSPYGYGMYGSHMAIPATTIWLATADGSWQGRTDRDCPAAGKRIVWVHARTGRQRPWLHGRRFRIDSEQRGIIERIIGLVRVFWRRRWRVELELRRRSYGCAAMTFAFFVPS